MDVDVLKQYPQIDCDAVQALLETRCREGRHKTVVLDDDPTGVQTVRGIPAYTDWPYESVKKDFEEENRLFYILADPRGFTLKQITRVHTEIGETAVEVSEETGIDYMIVSRGDSTPRGCYPLEAELLTRVEESHRGKSVDGEIICSYLKGDGCFTIDNMHYVKHGKQLVLAEETEFIGGKVFGYHSSDLREYVEEETEGRYGATDMLSVSLEELRNPDYDVITQKLLSLRDFRKVVVNAVDACNSKIFCIALYNAIDYGHRLMLRTAAGFAKEFGTTSDRPLLVRDKMVEEGRKTGGIIVIGSRTRKATIQPEALRQVSGTETIEFDSDLVLDEAKFQEKINTVLMRKKELPEQDVTAVIYTERKLPFLESDNPKTAPLRLVRISGAVQLLVGRLKVTPVSVVVKGGTTSSGVGTKALKVRQAAILGQARPGISAWETDLESRLPGTPYVIFPGDVGEVETSKEAVGELTGR